MELNKKKSVILPFGPRGAKDIPFLRLEKTYDEDNKTVKTKWTPTLNDISGTPIVNMYKYLGTYMEPKLTMTTQLENIKKKANFPFVKLYPHLINASADGREEICRTIQKLRNIKNRKKITKLKREVFLDIGDLY